MTIILFTVALISACQQGDRTQYSKQQVHEPDVALPEAAALPNIIYILADDAGINDFGAYGGKIIETPNIDRLAEEGIRFIRHYAGAPVCAPARSVLMTGLHSGHTRRRHNNPREFLKNEDLTVAEVLKQVGYRTAAIGKWGLGLADTSGAPTKQGFDYFFGYLDQSNAHSYYPEFLYRNEEKVTFPGNSRKRSHYSHDLMTEEALRFIADNKEAPFFLYLAYTLPHTALDVPEDSIRPYRGRFTETTTYEKSGIIQTAPRAAYAGMVSRLDRGVGRILQHLQSSGINEDTLVMFSSDNGANPLPGVSDFFDSNGIYRGHKRDLYEGGIITPFIARWTGRIAAGSVSGHLSGFQDILATVAEIVSIDLPVETDGISFLPTLLGKDKAQQKHGHLYWEFNHFHDEAYGQAQAVISDDWKLLRFQCSRSEPEACYELYNLKDDPGEANNLAHIHPSVVRDIAGLMDSSHIFDPHYPVIFYENERNVSREP